MDLSLFLATQSRSVITACGGLFAASHAFVSGVKCVGVYQMQSVCVVTSKGMLQPPKDARDRSRSGLEIDSFRTTHHLLLGLEVGDSSLAVAELLRVGNSARVLDPLKDRSGNRREEGTKDIGDQLPEEVHFTAAVGAMGVSSQDSSRANSKSFRRSGVMLKRMSASGVAFTT